MNMDHARELLSDALNCGLTLHGVSIHGKPAVSFDSRHPRADTIRDRFFSTTGLIRELLRAAMIEECQRQGLPDDLILAEKADWEDLPVVSNHPVH